MFSWSKIRDFLALRPGLAALLAMVVLVGLGERMAERFIPLYLTLVGGGAAAVGIFNGLNNLLGALYSYPGGWLSDRIGHKRALAVFNVLAMLGYLVVVVFPCWQAAIAGSVLFLSWTAVSMPASMDLISKSLPVHKHTMGVSMLSLVRRVPMAVGPLLGGALMSLFGVVAGIRAAFVAAFFLTLLSLVLQQLWISGEGSEGKGSPGNPVRVFRMFPPGLRSLLLSDILVRFCEQIPYAFVVIWCVSLHHVSPAEFGALTAIEMAVAAFVYIPVAHLADKHSKKPFVVATFFFFTLFPLVLMFSTSFWALVLAFVVRGCKEFGEPTRKAWIMELAPEGAKASSFGVYYLVRDVFVSLAAFGGALLWDSSMLAPFFTSAGLPFLADLAERFCSPQTNLLAAFLFGLAGTVFLLVKKEKPSCANSR